jgi:tight adherence protein B
MFWLIIIAAFLGVAALVGGVSLLFRGDGHTAAEQRLDTLTSAAPAPSGGPGALGELALLARPLDDAPGLVESLLARVGNIHRLLEQADSPLSSSKFFLAVASSAVVGALIFIVARAPVYLAPAGAATAAAIPVAWLMLRRKRRLAAFA